MTLRWRCCQADLVGLGGSLCSGGGGGSSRAGGVLAKPRYDEEGSEGQRIVSKGMNAGSDAVWMGVIALWHGG